MRKMPFSFKLERFEGPFELLFHLIDKNEIDIYDIPIAELTDQYLEYIKGMPADMDGMSEFIVMASQLIEIKSKMLLPKPEKEEQDDPRTDLVERLLEYKRFKSAANELLERRADDVFYRTQGDIRPPDLPPEPFIGLSPDDLFAAFDEAMRRRILRTDSIRASFSGVTKDLYTIADKIDEIIQALRQNDSVVFSSLLKGDVSEMVTIFLALLELIKSRRVECVQQSTFGEIVIYERAPLS